MRKSWPFALAVIVVGGLAGVAIAGRPVPSDQFVLDPSITVVIDSVPTSDEPAATTTVEPSVTPIASTTTESSTTSVAPTSATNAATTTTAQEATTTTVRSPVPRQQVRLVIANGDGRFRLAAITADRLSPLGYLIVQGDASRTVDATVIYYRAGFDDEAAIVANDILVPGAIITAFPTAAPPTITTSDDQGDVIVVLGPDAPR
ncbi:MAG: LytR C-terminal domain-containing protein [Ilumatobacteraceae bacterium]